MEDIENNKIKIEQNKEGKKLENIESQLIEDKEFIIDENMDEILTEIDSEIESDSMT